MRLIHLAAFGCVAVAACGDRDVVAADPAQSPSPTVMAPRSVYLSLSNVTPEPGAIIVVAANVKLDDSFAIASFVARLGFDPTTLEYLGEEPGADMMHVINAIDRQITVAAASAQGS